MINKQFIINKIERYSERRQAKSRVISDEHLETDLLANLRYAPEQTRQCSALLAHTI